jgi:hypothetical protein
MPKVRRQKLPQALLVHLLTRMRQRNMFKWFPGLTVCGEGELIKTFLLPGQSPNGTEV